MRTACALALLVLVPWLGRAMRLSLRRRVPPAYGAWRVVGARLPGSRAARTVSTRAARHGSHQNRRAASL